MAKNPSTIFYWKDWRSDEELRLCSLAAQGLWIRMLCYAAEADPVGYVLFQGRPISTTDLARLTGAPETEIENLLEELARNGVFSRDSRKRIFSRRMVRDAKRRTDGQKTGKLGGNPTLIKQTEKSPPLKGKKTGGDNCDDNGERSPTIPLNPNSTDPHVSRETNLLAPIRRVCEVFNVRLEESVDHAKWPAQLHDMLQSGLSLEDDILPSCVEARKRNVINLQWVRKRAEGEKAKRVIAATPATVVFIDCDDDEWLGRIRTFERRAIWPAEWGPKLGEPGCHVPAPIRARISHLQIEKNAG